MTALEVSLCFEYATFEQKPNSPYSLLGLRSVVVSPEDSVQSIFDAASSFITILLAAEYPSSVTTFNNLTLYEVRGIQIPHSTPPHEAPCR